MYRQDKKFPQNKVKNKINPQIIQIGNGRYLEIWEQNGLKHREDGPAWKLFSSAGVETEVWYIKDVETRNNGPSTIHYHSNGNIKLEHWKKNEKQHRDDGPDGKPLPATTSYYENGQIHVQIYKKNGVNHRTDGPALVQYHPNGKLHYIEWYINGARTTENNKHPISICYYENENKNNECWYEFYKSYNPKGASIIYYNEDETIIKRVYYLNHKPVSKRNFNKILFRFNLKINSYKARKREEIVNLEDINIIQKDTLNTISKYCY